MTAATGETSTHKEEEETPMSSRDSLPAIMATAAATISLEQTFVYQHPRTGAPSASALSVRQLARLLLLNRRSNHSKASSSILSPDTQMLQVESDGTYGTEWKPARTIPILKEACAEWYYTVDSDTSQPDDDKKKEKTTTTKGPVNCRELNQLYESGDIHEQTRLWCSSNEAAGSASSSWIVLSELRELRMAMDIFSNDSNPMVLQKQQQEETQKESSSDDTRKGSNGNDVQDELEAFLTETETIGPKDDTTTVTDEHGYESDGGTQYVMDRNSGQYVEVLENPRKTKAAKDKDAKAAVGGTSSSIVTRNNTNRKRKKPKFSSKNAKSWVYVTGLPLDCDEEEVMKVFSKVGIIDLDPDTQKPKIKLYRHKEDGPRKGMAKGDVSICFARPESVELALQLLDEAPFRIDQPKQNILRVERAKFEQHGKVYDPKRARVSEAKRKVAKLAALQAVGWDEGDNGRITGGRKGLCIVVLKHMFTLEELSDDEDTVLMDLERKVLTECESWGQVEKITVYSKNPEGVVIVRFSQPLAASTAVQEYNGRSNGGKKIEAMFWDGVTDYQVVDEEREAREAVKRQEEFGNWLEDQELPEEFRLNVES